MHCQETSKHTYLAHTPGRIRVREYAIVGALAFLDAPTRLISCTYLEVKAPFELLLSDLGEEFAEKAR